VTITLKRNVVKKRALRFEERFTEMDESLCNTEELSRRRVKTHKSFRSTK